MNTDTMGGGIPETFYAGVLIDCRRQALTANAISAEAIAVGSMGRWRRFRAGAFVRDGSNRRRWWQVVRVDGERGIVGAPQSRESLTEWISPAACNRLEEIPDVELDREQVAEACRRAAATLARYLGRPEAQVDDDEVWRVINGYSTRCTMRRNRPENA